MFQGKTILAVVPARSGSKGIPDKNICKLGGTSLIGWAGKTLANVDIIDAGIISTDSQLYADEAKKYGLESPFLRPDELSGDKTSSIEAMTHAHLEAEKYYGKTFDIHLIIEPTSPMRKPEDIIKTIESLVLNDTDSVVTVSKVDTKYHPKKILKCVDDKLRYFDSGGAEITSRQQLTGEYYYRNGICYALKRSTLIDKKLIFTDNTVPVIIERPIVNIDTIEDLHWAEFLITKSETD